MTETKKAGKETPLIYLADAAAGADFLEMIQKVTGKTIYYLTVIETGKKAGYIAIDGSSQVSSSAYDGVFFYWDTEGVDRPQQLFMVHADECKPDLKGVCLQALGIEQKEGDLTDLLISALRMASLHTLEHLFKFIQNKEKTAPHRPNVEACISFLQMPVNGNPVGGDPNTQTV